MQGHAAWLQPAACGVVVGALATMILGFTWLGWTLASTAERMAAQRAESAVVVALPPSCVARKTPNSGVANACAEELAKKNA